MPRHPYQPEIVKRSLANQAPWNAARERRLANYAKSACAIWLLAVVAVLIWARPWPIAVTAVAVCTLALLWMIVWTGAQQDKMAANRPNASNVLEMTIWHFHEHSAVAFRCPCGKTLFWKDAERFPKLGARPVIMPEAYPGEGRVTVDGNYPAGQARYSLVCECGRGHYKLIESAKIAKA